ncbi:hypothetical protein ACGFWI_37815 [Streptomyces sp. NPDC048434]|uniref:hypothetical protein n=1 Tax=Streptomyces sp. NPDC048434 TaxID=3365549 RepID=UPI0037202CFE
MPDNPCDMVQGPAHSACSTGGGGGSVKPPDPLSSMDPLTSLAHSTAKAAAWTARRLGDVIGSPNQVDFTNASFLQQYAVLFAATSVLVMVLWLFAVMKRAIRGAPMITAMREAIGLLWLAVGATAFTPLILYVVVQATSAVTTVLVAALGSTTTGGDVYDALAADLLAGQLPGGPLIVLVVSLATVVLCGALMLLLVLRALALYAGAMLGIVVYAGLIDREWWPHVRKWSGIMAAIIGVEPIIVIMLGLSAVLRGQHGHVLTGLAVTLATLGVSVGLITKVPMWGDGIRVARAAARTAGGAASGVINGVIGGGGGAAAGVMRGISTHGGRTVGGTSSTSSKPPQSNPISGGMAADSKRTPRQKPRGEQGK